MPPERTSDPPATPVLVTGAAGFIGFHVARRLLDRGEEVVGLDNLTPYYDVALKHSRLRELARHPRFRFLELDLANREAIAAAFREGGFERVVHLAAQAGVRYSLTHPHAYVDANLAGFLNVLEGCRAHTVRHLVYASSSSVYGANTALPFSVRDPTDHPLSVYAASKKANELLAYSYSHLYAVPATGLRFFTVYGPWGRPDMVLFRYTKAMLSGEPIEVFNHGHMRRDFTYVDDAVEAVVRVLDRPPSLAPPHRLYNVGSGRPVELPRLIDLLEQCLERRARTRMMDMQPGDVPATCADVSELVADVGYRPATPIEEGVRHFVAWYLEHYPGGVAGATPPTPRSSTVAPTPQRLSRTPGGAR